jgi:hypothetical protein
LVAFQPSQPINTEEMTSGNETRIIAQAPATGSPLMFGFTHRDARLRRDQRGCDGGDEHEGIGHKA